MPDANDAIEWDFYTLVDWWNLYGLPALLAAAAITLVVRSRSRPVATTSDVGFRTVLLVGLIHCAWRCRRGCRWRRRF